MSKTRTIRGLPLKIGPLGEYDRLLTLLSNEEGLTRLSVPGARRPKSNLSAALPLNFLEVQISGRHGLQRISQLKIVRSFNQLGQKLETLSAAQTISELSLRLVSLNDPIPGFLHTILIHFDRLEKKCITYKESPLIAVATCVQASIHLLALGGYGLPIQKCCKTDAPLDPPIGNWDWRCSLIPEEGFAIGPKTNATIELNPSELALLQRLLRPELPIKQNGELMGPKEVWIKLLDVVDYWTKTHLSRSLYSLKMLKDPLITKSS